MNEKRGMNMKKTRIPEMVFFAAICIALLFGCTKTKLHSNKSTILCYPSDVMIGEMEDGSGLEKKSGFFHFFDSLNFDDYITYNGRLSEMPDKSEMGLLINPENPTSTESYDRIFENPFLNAKENPLSTFSIDVDTASYANVRRFIDSGQIPPKDAVRIEEMINYFIYQYPEPEGDDPFSVTSEVASCPWNEEHRIFRIGLKGRELEILNKPRCNVVFLLDVSGSMSDEKKLPLVKKSLKMLVEELNEDDCIAIAVYAGASGLVLPSTPANEKEKIIEALDHLDAGGSTNGGEGIMLAYETAAKSFIQDGVNRVILCTDGDFNVGVTNQDDLTRLIEKEAKTGIFLSILGFGMGNYKDAMMEELSNKGNGNYAYIDSLKEARKVLVEQATGTLVTIAKDVKLQIEFNPVEVDSYRLIGYENRILRKEDFNDDKKDAGDIGAGHTVTALYEIAPRYDETDAEKNSSDPLRYQKDRKLADKAFSGEIATVKLRYKQPDGDTSKLLVYTVKDNGCPFSDSSCDLKFASSVAAFGMILRESEFKGNTTIDSIIAATEQSLSFDPNGYRKEFVELVKNAGKLNPPSNESGNK
jgi:Ca-activated chloride channel family protein